METVQDDHAARMRSAALQTLDQIEQTLGHQQVIDILLSRRLEMSADRRQAMRPFAITLKNCDWLFTGGPIMLVPGVWADRLKDHTKIMRFAFHLASNCDNLGQINAFNIEKHAKRLGWSTERTMAYLIQLIALGIITLRWPKQGPKLHVNITLHSTPVMVAPYTMPGMLQAVEERIEETPVVEQAQVPVSEGEYQEKAIAV